MNLKKEYILFDLDGTLTDPKIGITKSVQYALQKLGIVEPDLDKLEPFIGPPLKQSFREFYDMDEAQAEQAILYYRERFEAEGIYENKLYPKIKYLLKRLKANEMKLAIASSKPTVFVERILRYFGIDSYFDVVVGSELDGSRVEKSEIIKEALNQLFADCPIRREKVIMIGDRKFDIQGAKGWIIDSIGVTYGYGGREELTMAGATHIAASVEQLLELLLPKETRVKKESIINKIFYIAIPFFIFILARQVAIYIGYYGLSALFSKSDELYSALGHMVDGTIIVTSLGEALLSAFSFLVAGFVTWILNRPFLLKLEQQVKRVYTKKISIMECVLMVIGVISATLGLNLLLSLSGFVSLFSNYTEIATKQNDISFTMGIVVYVIAAPFAEELLFRGILYHRIVRMFDVRVGIIISSILFGIYHGNMVQGVFALIMGCLLASLYEKYGFLVIPIIVHSFMNITSFLLNIYSVQAMRYMNWMTCIISLAIASLVFIYLGIGKETIWTQFNKNKKISAQK